MKVLAIDPKSMSDLPKTSPRKAETSDRILLVDIADLAPGETVIATFHDHDDTTEKIVLRHTLNAEQIGWFWSGSALNRLRQKN